MKSITYIMLGMVILSMTMGSFTNLADQDKILFVETYNSMEVTSLLEKEDLFFRLVNTSQVDPEDARLGTCTESDAQVLWAHLHGSSIQDRFPKDLRFAWGWNSVEETRTIFALKASNEQNAPEKKDIQTVKLKEGHKKGSYDLILTFSEKGAKSWATMTRKNVMRNIAIVMDGKVVTAPKVQAEIKQGKCRISGDFNKQQALEIKATLES